MKNYRDRQVEVIRQAAEAAWDQPVLESGLWFHGDIRNNFYAASYLFAASAEPRLQGGFNHVQALRRAGDVLLSILSLQDRNPLSETFGHFPLNLGEAPREAQPNPLPAELMGCLLVYFRIRFDTLLTPEIQAALDLAIETLYASPYYRVPLSAFNHHEAKYTASKLIFGHRFGDDALLRDGTESLSRLLLRVQEQGLPEYGALPWFWHWVQALTCAYECVPVESVRRDLSSLLDELLLYRAGYYLKGAWIGGRMRSLAHDLPKDGNVAFDYIQFGDFRLPDQLPRVEYAGLLYYEAPEKAKRLALDVEQPIEVKRLILPVNGQTAGQLHSYIYRTGQFAVGGLWERAVEFDNEQHRWDISFPLREDGSINHLYFLMPGDDYQDGDPRHEHNSGEVLFSRHAVAALYPQSDVSGSGLVGVMPKGQWLQRTGGLFGRVGEAYVAVFSLGGLSIREEEDRLTVCGDGTPAGIVVEVMSINEANVNGVNAFADKMEQRYPEWNKAGQDGALSVEYVTVSGTSICLAIHEEHGVRRFLDGEEVKLDDYPPK